MNLEHSRIVWQGKWRLRVDSFRLADGQLYERGFIDHPGAVVVVPLLPGDDGDGAHGPQVLMLRQYRPALERTILELPAGTRETGEPWLECAQRELREETGQRAASFVPLGEVWAAPGLTNERMALFLACLLYTSRFAQLDAADLDHLRQAGDEVAAAHRHRFLFGQGKG